MKLHPLARQRLAEIKQKADLDPLEDYNAIEEINRLAYRAAGDLIEEPPQKACDAPITIDGIDLYPITMAGAAWLDYIADTWGWEYSALLETARIWAMAYGRSQKDYAKMWTERHARKRMHKLARRIDTPLRTITRILNLYEQGSEPGELEREIDREMAEKEKGRITVEPSAQEATNGVLEVIMDEYGGTREHWYWCESAATCRQLYMDALLARAEEYREAQGQKHPKDPRVEASFKLQKACRKLLERKTEKDSEET